jgi:hypothetical protein
MKGSTSRFFLGGPTPGGGLGGGLADGGVATFTGIGPSCKKLDVCSLTKLTDDRE